MSEEKQDGLFVVVEGPQWVGKTTLINGLKEHYGATSLELFIDDGSADIQEINKLRQVIEGVAKRSPPSPVTMITLAHALRDLVWQDKILPLLEEGHIVLVENWHLKTFVDQVCIAGGMQEIPITVLNVLLSAHDERCVLPDLIINLAAQPMQLIERRRSAGLPELTEGELTEEVGHLTRVAISYAQSATHEINRLIRAEGSADDVLKQVIEVIDAEIA